MAGFMSGMAGNVSAFSTVWTYDIFGALIHKKATDEQYVKMGRWSTVVGVIISIGTAYLVMHFKSIMDYVQALFSFFIAPLFGTVLLGMLWKRATRRAGFWGLLRARFPPLACRPGSKLIPRHCAMWRCRRTRKTWPRICTAPFGLVLHLRRRHRRGQPVHHS